MLTTQRRKYVEIMGKRVKKLNVSSRDGQIFYRQAGKLRDSLDYVEMLIKREEDVEFRNKMLDLQYQFISKRVERRMNSF